MDSVDGVEGNCEGEENENINEILMYKIINMTFKRKRKYFSLKPPERHVGIHICV